MFLFPGLRDSGGMAVLEAMAAAKPVISMDSGGPGLLVTEDTGIKVPVTTPDQVVQDLARALDSLLSDACLRRRMGQAARQRVIDEFVWESKASRCTSSIWRYSTTPVNRPRIGQRFII